MNGYLRWLEQNQGVIGQAFALAQIQLQQPFRKDGCLATQLVMQKARELVLPQQYNRSRKLHTPPSVAQIKTALLRQASRLLWTARLYPITWVVDDALLAPFVACAMDDQPLVNSR